MIHVGQFNTLEAHREVRGGWLLTDGKDTVMMPTQNAPWDIQIGLEFEVFVYTDTNDEQVATIQKPYGTVGQYVCLEVVDVAGPGAFCDWGLDKDLLIPNNKMRHPLSIGDRVVVAIVLGRQGRVMGVSWLHGYFRTDTSKLQVGQEVPMMVYGFTDRGTQVVVDQRWGGMLFHDQTHVDLAMGQEVQGFIQEIREDGRLDLTLGRQKAKREVIADDTTALAAEIQHRGGFLPLTDKSSPADIRRALRMSKKAFKRAIGGLYKARKIQIEERGIRWIGPSDG